MESPPVIESRGLTKEFIHANGETIRALDSVSITVSRGGVTGLIGPDGAGKTTFIRLAAGLFTPEAGSIGVLGLEVASAPQAVQSRVGYMPQKFGLYEDLTVKENLELYAELHGLSEEAKAERYPRLMQMTGLSRFTGRLAGRLSGGMKQKLGLACTLVSTPGLLLLDEPTVGVDPLSRKELWEIVYHLVEEQKLTVLLSTSYLDEAERCGEAILLFKGRVLESGPPSKISAIARGRTFLVETPPTMKPRQLQFRLAAESAVVDASLSGDHVRVVTTGEETVDAPVFRGLRPRPVEPRFEDGFMTLVREASGVTEKIRRPVSGPETGGVAARPDEVVVEVRHLYKRFGDFTAVKDASFQVRRGEIFGLLGPNGAGKSTTFRMLCGLLPPSEGTLGVSGVDLRRARASARRKIGYVAQKFSLYGQLTVAENLEFFASAYGLRGARKRERTDWAILEFDLKAIVEQASGELPAGYKQRLAMACALMHEPDTLFLDEPTSGVDPLARREFWQRISTLADSGVTVIVTTHFLEEAEYCDRMVVMVDGEILAAGTPAAIRARARVVENIEPTIEDAFISIVEDYRKRAA